MSRRTEIVRHDPVTIETYVDEGGPDIVILPSYGRDGGEDFNPLTDALVDAGHRVLRPQPRGIAGSTGPMQSVTIDDGGDVIDALAGDPPVVVLGSAFSQQLRSA